jgi:hypothetical protein
MVVVDRAANCDETKHNLSDIRAQLAEMQNLSHLVFNIE